MRPSRSTRSRAAKPSSTVIDGVCLTAAVSACMMARPGAVAFGNGRGDAGLRPKARGAFTEARRRVDGDGNGRKLERGEKPGKSGAHHDHAAGPALPFRWELAVRCHRRIRLGFTGDPRQWLRLIMRSTEARARAAMAGSIVTSSLRNTRDSRIF